MYRMELPNGSEFTLPKESIRVLARIKAHDCKLYKNFRTDTEAIEFLERNGITVEDVGNDIENV